VRTAARYRKRPVVIDAFEYTGDNAREVLAWAEGSVRRGEDADGETRLVIDTKEGVLSARVGDFIVRGVEGEYYPCAPRIFAATYEPAESSTPWPASR
jgi:hypothetical protein